MWFSFARKFKTIIFCRTLCMTIKLKFITIKVKDKSKHEFFQTFTKKNDQTLAEIVQCKLNFLI